MHISWLGGSCFKIQTKPQEKELTILIDPYKPRAGTFPQNLSADIVLYTRGAEGSIAITGNPFVLDTPGECETNHVLLTGTFGKDNHHMLIRIDTEQMSVGHMGLANTQPSDLDLELLGDVDILLLPVGGAPGYDADQAAKAVNAVEPRIVIPCAYKSDNDPTAHDVLPFLKELGATNGEPEKKVIIKKKDLPEEDTRVIVLAKE